MELLSHSFVTCTVFSSDARVPFMLFQQSVGGVLDGAEGGTSWGREQGGWQMIRGMIVVFLCRPTTTKFPAMHCLPTLS